MGTTAKGFRYPEPTDLVTDGATAMQNLATDVDGYFPGAYAAIPLASGIVTNTGTPGWRKGGDVITLRGQVKKTDGTNFASLTSFTIGTLPVGARPSGAKLLICATSNQSQPARVTVNTTGTVVLDTPASASFNVLVLDGIEFDTAGA